MQTIFETQRLRIRNYKLADLDTVHEYAQQEKVVQYEGWGPNTVKETLTFIGHAIAASMMNPRPRYELCIELKPDLKQIGGCAIYFEKGEAYIGYIINPEYWGNGYATEATLGLIEFADENLGISKLIATADKRNIASNRVLQKCGFVLQEIREKDVLLRGTMRDTCVYHLAIQ